MTPQEAKQLLPVIQAYAEGKQIQVKSGVIDEQGRPTYKDLTVPSFDADPSYYRVKPEPRDFWVVNTNNGYHTFSDAGYALQFAQCNGEPEVIHTREII